MIRTKNALSLIIPAFFLVVAGMLIVMMFQIAQRYASEESLSQHLLTKDMALFTDTLMAAPGNFYLFYQRDMGTGTVRFRDNTVSIGNNKAGHISSMELLDASFEDPARLYFVKRGNTLVVVDTPEKLPKTIEHLSCPIVETRGLLQEQQILLDPQHGGEDFGLISSSIAESTYVEQVMRGISSMNLAIKDHLHYTRSLELGKSTEISLEQRASLKSDKTLILSLGIGAGDLSTQDVIAYIPNSGTSKLASKKLACVLLNALSSRYPVNNLRYLEVPPKGEHIMLSGDVPSVILEIGNIDYSGDQSLLHDPVAVGNILYEGVVDYLE